MIQIYGTLGPACADEKILAAMLRADMTGLRLNLSHTMLTDAAAELSALRRAEQETGKTAQLLIDLQGPEVRIGKLPSALTLQDGDCLIMGEDIPVPAEVLEALAPGQRLLLDDGKLLLEMETPRRAKVLRGGVLTSRKSLAIENMDLHLPALTEDDRINLSNAVSFGVTGVMQPFVRSAEDLITLRNALNAAGGESIRILAKVESQAGMAHLPELLPHADEIVIARGDLGNAMPLWDLPGAQKNIAAICRDAKKPFLVVTQMLASMEHAAVPTRAEVSDIFNAVLDGAQSLMLTGETAVGDYPAESIRWMARTAAAAEAFRNQ